MKDTSELEKILNETRLDEAEGFIEDNTDSMYGSKKDFSKYVRGIFSKKGLRQQDIFLWADIPERYGYKLISGEKKTRQRDVILRICYAAEFSLEETQKALRIYGLPQLYARIPRDAVLMIVFNTRPGSIIEVNQFLKNHNMEPLRTSGLQD